jgi:hypothetical protein
MSKSDRFVGWASLWCSILGLVVPISLVVLLNASVGHLTGPFVYQLYVLVVGLNW